MLVRADANAEKRQVNGVGGDDVGDTVVQVHASEDVEGGEEVV